MTRRSVITHTHRNVTEAIAPPHTRLKDQYPSNRTILRKYRHLDDRLLVYWLHLPKRRKIIFDAGARIYARASAGARDYHRNVTNASDILQTAGLGPSPTPRGPRTPRPAARPARPAPPTRVERVRGLSQRVCAPTLAHPSPNPNPRPTMPPTGALPYGPCSSAWTGFVYHTIHSGGSSAHPSPASCFLHM